MTYLIPSLIAAVIIWIFARRLNSFDNSEASYAMETPDSSSARTQNYESGTTGADSTGSTSQNTTEDNPSDAAQEDEEKGIETSETVALICDLLKRMGCQPEIPREDTITVRYQGENFLFGCNGVLVDIYDLPWSHIDVNDPNEQALKEAINKTNFSILPTILIQSPDEEGHLNILSRYQTIIHPSCTINEQFIGYIFHSFFEAKRKLGENWQELTSEQQQPKKSRRPVGFSIQEPSEE